MVYKRYAYKKEKDLYLPKKKRKMDNFIKENITLKRMRNPGIEVFFFCWENPGIEVVVYCCYKLREAHGKGYTVTCKLYSNRVKYPYKMTSLVPTKFLFTFSPYLHFIGTILEYNLMED